MIKKLLIANRGEIALRVIRSAKELGIKTVAIYSEVDKDSLHVKLADEAICIGSDHSKDSYLKIPNVIAAAEITRSDAIHPGYGFLSENPEFAKICSDHNINFVGPTFLSIEKMGNKLTARQTAVEVGVPIISGTKEIVTDPNELIKMAKEIGYPVMIKASSGGGGKGIRIVKHEKDLLKELEIAQKEAKTNFGDETVYLEKYIQNPKHIEIQIISDKYGNVLHLGERDCSIQRRNQKIIEEAPSVVLDNKLREKMCSDAIKLVKAINYVGAGTIEFLLDKDKNYYFIEMNTRIQVEHTITEMITGLDIVKMQILIASGEKLLLKQKDIKSNGHAIECRINAEDPDYNFRPSSGVITNYIPSGGYGIRIDSHIYSNYKISIFYDSLLGKIIAHGNDREEAISKMKRALNEHKIEGVKTTIPFLLEIMQDIKYIKDETNTTYVETFLSKKR